MLVNQHSAPSSETECVGKSTSGSIVGKGEWGKDESSVCVREKLGKGQRSGRGARGNTLFMTDENPTLSSNLSSFGDDSSPRDGVQSPVSGFSGLAGE